VGAEGQPLRARRGGCTAFSMLASRMKRHPWPLAAWAALLPALVLMCLLAGDVHAQGAPNCPAPAGRPSSTEAGKTILTLCAGFGNARNPVGSGLQWRVYQERAQPDGSHTLVADSSDALTAGGTRGLHRTSYDSDGTLPPRASGPRRLAGRTFGRILRAR
jgi:hypothetical protein